VTMLQGGKDQPRFTAKRKGHYLLHG
jgi:hypothetical protein